MFWKDFIPPHKIDEARIMGEEVINLRDWVFKNRKINITFPLYIFEFRVLLSDIQIHIMNETMYKWKEISEDVTFFECNTDDGIYSRGPNNRELKQYMLIGWMEYLFWVWGNKKKQKIYPIPDHPEQIGYHVSDTDQFLDKNLLESSFQLLHNFYDKYFNHFHVYQKMERILLFNNINETDNNLNRFVYAPADLWLYYYGEYKKKDIEPSVKTFYPMKNEMKTINFARRNESLHTGIANCISWQTFFHVCNHPKKERKMKPIVPNNTINIEFSRLPDNIKHVLYKVALEPSVCRLDETDRETLFECNKYLPENSTLMRFIKYLFHKENVAWQFSQNERQKRKRDDFFLLIHENIKNYVGSIATPWIPQFAGQHVGAADIPEQNHTFNIDNGQVNISCLWKGAYKDDPAYIVIKWVAVINAGHEIWVAFFNPETKKFLSEIILGVNLKGQKILLSNQLNFDPIKEKWAVSIFIKNVNKVS